MIIKKISGFNSFCWPKVTSFILFLGAFCGFASESSACILSGRNLADYLYANQIVVADIFSATRKDAPEPHLLIEAKNVEYLRGSGPEKIDFTLRRGSFGLPSIPVNYGRALIGLGSAATEEIEKDGWLWAGRVIDGTPWMLQALCDPEGQVIFERDSKVLFSALLAILNSSDPLQGFACLSKNLGVSVSSEVFANGEFVVCEADD